MGPCLCIGHDPSGRSIHTAGVRHFPIQASTEAVHSSAWA